MTATIIIGAAMAERRLGGDAGLFTEAKVVTGSRPDLLTHNALEAAHG